MAQQVKTVDRVIARIARRAHGVVTRAELRDAGVSVDQITERVRRGVLIPVYRGVYRVGHAAPSIEATYVAAVKACGEGAVLSGRAAAWLWGLVRGSAPPPEVTCPTQRRIPGLRIHHCRRLADVDRERRRGIPITSVPRTIVDLAAAMSDDALALLCHEAGVLHRTTPRQVDAVLARRPTASGARKLRRVIHGDVHVSLSRLESRFLTVELDSYRFHNSRHSWMRDREREREAYARGDQFRRYTWGDVFEAPQRMLRELRGLLLGRLSSVHGA